MTPEEFKQLCIDLEHFQTPEWAAEEILNHEILTRIVIDPCVGAGNLAYAAKSRGYEVNAFDIHDWGYRGGYFCKLDFLNDLENFQLLFKYEFTIFMNPPFSKAEAFVEKALKLGARKIVCFQRFAWWESEGRREWWDKHTPQRIYICGSRATCWRHDIPLEERGSGTPTAHAWFVWERGQPCGPMMGRIYKR